MPLKAGLSASGPFELHSHQLAVVDCHCHPGRMPASFTGAMNAAALQPTFLSAGHHFFKVLGVWYGGGLHPNEVREWVGGRDGDPPKGGV